MIHTTILRDALQLIADSIPACDNGTFFTEHFTPDGEQMGIQQHDPVAIIGYISEVARAALAAADADQAGDAGPTMDQMIALMHEAKAIAPNLTTVDPIPLTPVQVAWIVGKVRIATRPAPVGAVQAPDLSDIPVLWVESEPSARLLDLAEVMQGTCHTVMYHTFEPRTSNPVWPLYERKAAAPAAPIQQATRPAEESASNQELAHSGSQFDQRQQATIAPSSSEHAKPEPVEQAPLAYVLDFVPEAPDGPAEEALTPDEFALYSAMSDISEERWFAGWMGGNEYELWSALQDGEIGGCNRNTLAYIAAMSVKTGKWIVWHSDADANLSGPRAVSLLDWIAMYDAKNDMRAGQQAGAVDGAAT